MQVTKPENSFLRIKLSLGIKKNPNHTPEPFLELRTDQWIDTNVGLPCSISRHKGAPSHLRRRHTGLAQLVASVPSSSRTDATCPAGCVSYCIPSIAPWVPWHCGNTGSMGVPGASP